MSLRIALVALALLASACSETIRRTPSPSDDDGSDAGGAPPATNAGGAPPATDAGGAPPATDAGGAPPATDAGGAPPATDAGGAPPATNAGGDAGGAPEPPLDVGSPVPGCSEPIVLAVEDSLRNSHLAISQGRYAVTWTWSGFEGGERFSREMLAILDEGARLIAPPREIEFGPMLLALDDGFLTYDSTPSVLQAFDLDGRERGPALRMPEKWSVRSIGRDGSLVRVLAQEAVAHGESALFVADLAAESPALERRELTAPDWGVGRVLSAGRDLAFQGRTPLRMAEISYPSGDIVFEWTWDRTEIDEKSDAQYDAARSEWIVLGGEERVMGGTYTAPVALFLGSDGGVHKIDAPDAPILRAVKGNVALGDGSIGFAFWDYHSAGLLWFLRGDGREPTVPRRIDREFSPKIAWHAPTSSYAVLTESSQYSPPITLSLRCGVMPE